VDESIGKKFMRMCPDPTEKKETLANWVRQYTQVLYSWALTKTSNPTLSEDLVQETFLAAAENLERFQGTSRPKTWLFGILKHKIADHYRKQASRPQTRNVPSDDLATFFDDQGRWRKNAKPQPWSNVSDNLLDNPSFQGVLATCMEKLPALMHACLQLTYIQEKKGPEICQEIGLTTTNYWKIMSRARLR
jgi:RNA polymerase sigma factor (sigma-70 family)